METMLQKILADAPQMGVLLVVVWMFLRAMEKRDSFIKQLHDEHIEARRAQQTAIADNTAATIDLTRSFKSLNNR
jgi:hypothetical protein